MKFKATKIATAVAAGLGISAMGMNVAQAREVMFPYVVAGPTVATILSVVNDDDDTRDNQILHYRYYAKTGAAATDNGAVCAYASIRRNTSPGDVVTFDVSGHFGDADSVLFEPTHDSPEDYDGSFAVYSAGNQPARAFAIVDNNDLSANVFNQDISGEAFIIQFTEGSVWGYAGYTPARVLTGTPLAVLNPFDFSDWVETAGEVLVAPPRGTTGANADNYWVPMPFMPFDEVTTRLFVTPIGSPFTYYTFDNPPGFIPSQLANGFRATITGIVSSPTNATWDVAYDRDENPLNGATPQTVRCVGAVDVRDLISNAVEQFLPNGGWTNIMVTLPVQNDADGNRIEDDLDTDQAIVMKLEFNDTPPAMLDGELAGGGSYNNGIWLRKGIRESRPRPLALYAIRDAAGNVLEENSPLPSSAQ